MPNSIAYAQNYVAVIDEVYQRAGVSNVLNSGRRMVRAGHNAKEILIPKISVTGLGDYTRNVGYKTGAITYEFETKTFNFLPNSGESRIDWRHISMGLDYPKTRQHIVRGICLAPTSNTDIWNKVLPASVAETGSFVLLMHSRSSTNVDITL